MTWKQNITFIFTLWFRKCIFTKVCNHFCHLSGNKYLIMQCTYLSWQTQLLPRSVSDWRHTSWQSILRTLCDSSRHSLNIKSKCINLLNYAICANVLQIGRGKFSWKISEANAMSRVVYFRQGKLNLKLDTWRRNKAYSRIFFWLFSLKIIQGLL